MRLGGGGALSEAATVERTETPMIKSLNHKLNKTFYLLSLKFDSLRSLLDDFYSIFWKSFRAIRIA